MSTIESKKVQVNAAAPEVSEFLSNTDNLYALLPQSRITEWKSDGSRCSFKVQGAYTIGLQKADVPVGVAVMYASSEGSPFPFTLQVHMQPHENTTRVWQVCHAEINPFLEMMVKGPLKNLFDYMADQLVVQFAAKG